MYNHTYLKRSITAAVMAAAIAYPAAAQAAHILQPEVPIAQSASVPSVGPGLAVVHQLNQLQGNVRERLVSEDGSATVPRTAPTAALPSAGSGFQWDDAGIGAAGAVVLMGAAAVGTGLSRRRRTAFN
jgi:hypothetical protein